MMTKEGSTNYVKGKKIWAWAWPYSDNAIFVLFLSTLGLRSDKLKIK